MGLALLALPDAAAKRIRSYAKARGLTLGQAVGELAIIALDHLEARQRGGASSLKTMTAEQRSARARAAVAAREARKPRP